MHFKPRGLILLNNDHKKGKVTTKLTTHKITIINIYLILKATFYDELLQEMIQLIPHYKSIQMN